MVELDGDSHYDERVQRYDERRTAQLGEEGGVRVVRFTNTDVMQNFEGVCAEILRIVAATKPPGPSGHPPCQGGKP